MRARLLRAWPNLSHFFHIRPWEVPLLSEIELAEYLSALQQLEQSSRRKR